MLHLIPCELMNCTPPGSSVHVVFMQEYWSGSPFPPPGDLPDPGTKPKSPALAGGFFTVVTARKPYLTLISRAPFFQGSNIYQSLPILIAL